MNCAKWKNAFLRGVRIQHFTEIAPFHPESNELQIVEGFNFLLIYKYAMLPIYSSPGALA